MYKKNNEFNGLYSSMKSVVKIKKLRETQCPQW